MSVGVNCDNSGTPEQGLRVLRRNDSFVRKNGDSWRSINTDESTGRLFGRGTHANLRLWFTRAPRKFGVRPIPKTKRSRETRPRAKNALLRREWQTASSSSSRTLRPEGTASGAMTRVQRLIYSATVTIKWRKNRYRFVSATRYRWILFRVFETNQHTTYLIRSRNFVSRPVQWIFLTTCATRSKCVTQFKDLSIVSIHCSTETVDRVPQLVRLE